MTWGPLTTASLARPLAPTSSFVYFILDADRKQVKIGVARNPTKRLSSMQTGSATELELVGCLAGGRELEKELHAAFAEDRQRGEWFSLTHKLVDLLDDAERAALTGERPSTDYDDEWTAAMTLKVAPKVAADLAEVMGISDNQARRFIRTDIEARHKGVRVRFAAERQPA